jgi:hypothetical protein
MIRKQGKEINCVEHGNPSVSPHSRHESKQTVMAEFRVLLAAKYLIILVSFSAYLILEYL